MKIIEHPGFPWVLPTLHHRKDYLQISCHHHVSLQKDHTKGHPVKLYLELLVHLGHLLHQKLVPMVL
jgi:hypothetical protein